MKIATKEVITLTDEEKEAINKVYILMTDVIEQSNDSEVSDAAQRIYFGLADFQDLVDMDK